jgi:hypothetical protein
MFSSSKKFLMPSRASRAEKKEGRLRPSDQGNAEAGGQTEATVERVRLAMSGAMQACLHGAVGGPVDETLAGRVTPVQEGVGGHDNTQVDVLQRQLRSARDLDTLWYLRPGLMNVIAVRQGEVAARDCLVALTALFKQHQPSGRSSRPGAF